jgi:hypothetical protein
LPAGLICQRYTEPAPRRPRPRFPGVCASRGAKPSSGGGSSSLSSGRNRTLGGIDTNLTPAGVQIVGSAYTNSSFTAFATRPTVTELYAYDIGASPDKLWIQRPANAGTLITPISTGPRPRQQRRLRHRRRRERRLARGDAAGPLRLSPVPTRCQHGSDEVAGTNRRRLPDHHRPRSRPGSVGG